MIALTAGTSLSHVQTSVARRDRDWSQFVARVTAAAMQVVCEAFPEAGLKRFRSLRWFPYHGLSRARNGVNCPLARVAVWFAGLRALGVGRAVAQLLVDWLQDVVDELWPADEIDVIAASDEEQHWEGIETSRQMVVIRQIGAGDTSCIDEYVAASRRERAAQRVLEDGLLALAVTLNPARRSRPAPAALGGGTV